MKKHLASIALIAAFVVLPAATFAASGFTQISGTVYTNNNQKVSGAKVTVICDGHSKKTITASNGSYLVQYATKKCPAGSNATASATKGTKTGSNSEKVNNVTGTTINLAIVNITIPEFSAILGFIAVLIAGGAFLSIRSRKTNAGKIA